MQFIFRQSRRTFQIIIFLAIFSFLCFYILIYDGSHKVRLDHLRKLVPNPNETIGPVDKLYPMATNYERKDWHDWKFIEYEKSRQGPGEQGEPHYLTDANDIALNEKLFKVEGLYVVVSDRISVNRSVPDTRLPM